MTIKFNFQLPNGKTITGKVDEKKFKTKQEQENYKRRWKREQIKIYNLHKKDTEPVGEVEEVTATDGNITESVNLPEHAPIQQEPEEEEIKENDIEFTKFKLNISPKEEGGTTTLVLGASKSGKTTKM